MGSSHYLVQSRVETRLCQHPESRFQLTAIPGPFRSRKRRGIRGTTPPPCCKGKEKLFNPCDGLPWLDVLWFDAKGHDGVAVGMRRDTTAALCMENVSESALTMPKLRHEEGKCQSRKKTHDVNARAKVNKDGASSRPTPQLARQPELPGREVTCTHCQGVTQGSHRPIAPVKLFGCFFRDIAPLLVRSTGRYTCRLTEYMIL
ncbi:hypothetical protein V8C37DRAFT_263321 [Trichoderma ceciliae]